VYSIDCSVIALPLAGGFLLVILLGENGTGRWIDEIIRTSTSHEWFGQVILNVPAIRLQVKIDAEAVQVFVNALGILSRDPEDFITG
jgi:hypothetical protein